MPYTLYCYLYPPSLRRRTHQHKVMALFVVVMQGTARALPLMPRQSREELQRQARRAPCPAPCSQPCSQPRAAPLAADTCNPAHSSCMATAGITGITLRVPCTGTEPVHLSDTYRNRKGAEAPDTHQALLLLWGKHIEAASIISYISL